MARYSFHTGKWNNRRIEISIERGSFDGTGVHGGHWSRRLEQWMIEIGGVQPIPGRTRVVGLELHQSAKAHSCLGKVKMIHATRLVSSYRSRTVG
jgi:hypothetical protein